MTGTRTRGTDTDPGELLERSLAYALGSVAGVEGVSPGRHTPCPGWDLGALLGHLDDALDALYEGLTGGVIGPFPGAPEAAACGFRRRACAVLGAWAAGAPERVAVGDRALPSRVMVAVGAVEIAVHGWDVGQAGGRPVPLPVPLAAELLPVARQVVADADRGVRFAAPLAVPPSAGADERLLAFLGRRSG